MDSLARTAELGDDAPLLSAVRALVDAHESRDLAEFDAGARDLPARQRLQQVSWVMSVAVRKDATAAPSALAVSRILAGHALLADLAVPPAMESVRWHSPEEATAVLLEVAAVTARAPVLDVAVDLVESQVRARIIRVDPASVLEVVRRLVADPRPEPARLGLAVLDVVAELHGWDEERLAVLRQLRRHPDEGVRLAAVRVATVSE